MRAYIVTCRHLEDKERGIWSGEKISQEAYATLENAQRFIESRYGRPVKVTEMYYQTEHFEEYYIHDIRIVEEKKADNQPLSRSYEHTRAAVMASGNR